MKTTVDARIEKVKATILQILELADSTTFEGEAATAMFKAKELLDKYGLKLEDITQMKAKGEIGVIEVRVPFLSTPRQKWERDLGGVIGEWIGVRVLSTKAAFYFVGYPEDAEMAGFLFSQIRGRLKEIGAEAVHNYIEKFKRDHGVSPRFLSGPQNWKVWRNSFMDGAVMGIFVQAHRLKEPVSQSETNSLIVLKEKDINTYLQEKYPRLSTQPIESYGQRHPGAYNLGFDTGSNLEIRQGLTE